MDEPVRRRLRPARRRGLTRPEPVTALLRPHAATRQNASQHPRQGHTDRPQKSKRQISHTAVVIKISTQARPPEKRAPEFMRWIEAKLEIAEQAGL